jgi:hypothetical protein
MGMDRFIKWKKPRKSTGTPTLEKLVKVAQEFLGARWKVTISTGTTRPCWIVCETDEPSTYPLINEYVPSQEHDGPPTSEEIERFRKGMAKMDRGRGFEIYFPGAYGETKERSSVITRMGDDFTNALADRLALIISHYWNGKLEMPS